MSSDGTQALMQPPVGIHMAGTHNELVGLLEIARVLVNSYRLASSEPGSGVLHGRFTFNFCRTFVAGIALGPTSIDRSIEQTTEEVRKRRT